jgi:hypothetical protein
MLRQGPGESVNEYVHFMRQSFDDCNETCQMIDGSAAIHPHNLDLLMFRGISSSREYRQAKQCAINAFNTDYLSSVTRTWQASCTRLRIWRSNFISMPTHEPTLMLQLPPSLHSWLLDAIPWEGATMLVR